MSQMSFTGRVVDAGGGQVDILIARDTESYPPVGTEVTVTYHADRYHVTEDTTGRYGPAWHVWDRESGDRCVAEFHTELHPDARCAAKAEAERLNNPMVNFVTGEATA